MQHTAYMQVHFIYKSYQIVHLIMHNITQAEKFVLLCTYNLYFILLGLNEYTTYSVSVAANNSFGIGPYSQPVQVKTQESSKSIIVCLFFVAALLAT